VSTSATARPMNLYSVKVFGVGGLVGSFFAAALDKQVAVAIGESWAAEHDLKAPRVKVERFADHRQVYMF
jgi:hypothetical protein